MEGASLQTAHLISNDDAINRTDEHLPSGSEQTPTRDKQAQELPSAQELLATDKNISLLHRLNRDLQYKPLESQPGDESKGHLTGW